MIELFHFLRPAWFLALLPLGLLIWLMWNSVHLSRSWRTVIDPKLLPFLLAGNEQQQIHRPVILSAIVGLLAIVALAGPVWEKRVQPVFTQQAALVIALDLSASMDAGDIKPSRLARARHKIADILDLRDEGQTSLIVYAAQAFAVTPLTEDSKTIKALLPGLVTDMMPAQGSRADRALNLAISLMENAGVSSGDILFVSDGVTQSELEGIRQRLAGQNAFRISVLGVGTEEGGPIPLANGGFLKDDQAAIVIPRLAATELRELANSHQGVFRMMSVDDDDIQGLLDVFEKRSLQNNTGASDLQVAIWREQGPWLLLILLPLVALVFRRGVLLVLPLFLIPYPTPSVAFEWNDLWQNNNQRGSLKFDQGEHAKAAELFNQRDWKASSFYRSGDYQKAFEYWDGKDSESALYNKGNALAKLGKLEEAIESYQRVLETNPSHEDALHNKKLLEDALQQQQQQQDQKGDQSQDQEGDSEQKKDQQQSESENNESESQSSDEKKDGSQDESQSKQNQQSEAEQQAAKDSKEQQAEDDQQSSVTNDPQQQSEAESSASIEDKMSEQAAESWLRKIPDDPGELLKRKFLYQYGQRENAGTEKNPW